jgi:Protein of unknown function (DUF1569)
VVSLLDTAARVSLEARVNRLRPESTGRWGRMTVHQAICHMSDAFRMALNERRVAPVTLRFRPVVRFVALWVPLPWPGGRIRTVPEVEQGVGGTAPTEFERDRLELIALMSRFCAAGVADRCPDHPIFGPMSRTAWGRWAYLHVDHHLRQFGV